LHAEYINKLLIAEMVTNGVIIKLCYPIELRK